MRSLCTRRCWRTGDELRARVKGDENEGTELASGLADAKHRIGVDDDQKGVALEKCSGLRQNLRDVEKARLDAHHERYELRRRLRSLDHERTRCAGELEDARVRATGRSSWCATSESGRWSLTVLRRSSALGMLRTRSGRGSMSALSAGYCSACARSTCSTRSRWTRSLLHRHSHASLLLLIAGSSSLLEFTRP